MTDQELERQLRTALEHAAPDDLEGVLSRCKPRSGTVIPFEQPKKKPRRRAAPWLAAACLALVLVGGGFGFSQYRQAGMVASVISLDVNPSVELNVNSRERVIAAVPINDDANEILDGMELKGTDLNVAINAIMGSLLKHGYVDELANSILISVEDDDAARGAALEQKLTTEIEQVLASAQVNGAILSQTLSGDTTLQQKADEYGISLGKAALIQSLVDGSSHLTFESLVGLSINELNLLVNSTAVQTESGGQTANEANTALHSVGNASQSGYIGVETAKATAMNHAGVTAADTVFLEADYDYEDGRMVYEIEFVSGGVKYEYDIDASTGEVVKYEREGGLPSGGSIGTGAVGMQNDVGETAAKAAALSHAGVTERDARNLTVKRDYDDGRLIYEIDFWVGTAEYEYEINAADAGVLKSKREKHPNALPAEQAIGGDMARDVALTHAGVRLSDVYELEVEEELDERIPCYKVEFKAGGMEYEYKIDAQSGGILSFESDID